MRFKKASICHIPRISETDLKKTNRKFSRLVCTKNIRIVKESESSKIKYGKTKEKSANSEITIAHETRANILRLYCTTEKQVLPR